MRNVDEKPQNAGGRVALRHHLMLLLVIGSAAFLDSAAAEHWMFQPSYYSHTIAPPDRPLPSSRSSYRVPSVGNNPGFSVRGEYRVNFLRFRNGLSNDIRIQYRNRVELDP